MRINEEKIKAFLQVSQSTNVNVNSVTKSNLNIGRLIYEQDRLLERIQELLLNFDAELRLLRHDKFKLDIVMKNADLR